MALTWIKPARTGDMQGYPDSHSTNMENHMENPQLQIISGWWCTYPSETYEFVNGKDDIPYMKWKIKNVWNHQPDFEEVIHLQMVYFGSLLHCYPYEWTQ